MWRYNIRPTSAKEVMIMHLRVCVSEEKLKKFWKNFFVIGNNWLDFSGHQDHDADTGYPVAPCVPPETEADPVQRLFCQLNLAFDGLLVIFRL